MPKRARYDGAYNEVTILWPPGAVNPENTWTVERGHYLPADAPAPLRNELTAGPDWTEVDYTPPGEKKAGDR